MPYGIPTLIKFPGLDGHPVAVDRSHVLFVDESAVAGEPVTNVHFHNGKWVTVRGTIDEVVAVLSDSFAQTEEKELESYRTQARLRRQARAEVDAVLRAVSYEGPKPQEWGIETLPDGRRKVTAFLEPLPIPSVEDAGLDPSHFEQGDPS